MKIKEPKLLKLEVGKYYKTYGGWRAIVIWEKNIFEGKSKIEYGGQVKYYVIHKPKEEDERYVISHTNEGRAVSEFSVGEPPQFGTHHPADLKELWK